MGECTPVDKRALPFFDLVELSNSVDSSLVPVLYLLSKFLLIPSLLTSVPWTLDFLSPIVQSEHHSLQPFFTLGIEYGIDVRSLVLESPWFWYSFENFSPNYLIMKKAKAKREHLSWFPNRLAELWVNILFLPLSSIIIYFTTYLTFHWLTWKKMD